jgi:hypothetical protein
MAKSLKNGALRSKACDPSAGFTRAPDPAALSSVLYLPPEADVSGVIALFGLGHRSDFPMTVGSNANVSSCE